MLRVVAKRAALSVPLLLGVSMLTFFLTALIPGDPARTILGTRATPESIAALNAQLGLDRPLYEQYGSWLGGLSHGDLGRSLFSGESVASILGSGLPITVSLIALTVGLSALIGIPVGVISASHARSGGRLIDALAILGYALPAFFLGLLLAYLFANVLSLLPASGWVDPSQSFDGWVRSVILPVTTLSIAGIGLVARQTRQGMVDVLDRPFIHALRARGIPERVIVYRHALRNALGNVITVLGVYVVSLLLGSTLVETVFALQGLGSIAVRATSEHDLPVLEGAALVFTLVVVVAFIGVDLLRAWLNPKLRTR